MTMMNLLHNTRRILREHPNLKRACEKLAKENNMAVNKIVLEPETGYSKNRRYKKVAHLSEDEQNLVREELKADLEKGNDLLCIQEANAEFGL